jgi:outer membrane protein TolC
MQLKLKVMSSVMLLLICHGSAAQAAEVPFLSLQEAISKGLKQNNMVRAAGFQADAARSGATAASLHFLPSISVEESWSRSNVPVNTFMMKLNQGRFSNQDFDAAKLNNPSPVGDFKTSVTVEQPLLVPTAWAAKKVAQYGADQQEAGSELTKQQTAFQIFHLYLDTLKAHAYLLAAEKALEEARESKRQAEVRTAAGMGLKSDELRARTHLAAMEQQKISADNNLTLTRMQLALATGGQPGDQVDVMKDLQLKLPVKDLKTLLSLAQQERRDLLASERGRDQAEAMLLQAQSGFLPNLGAIGSWQMDDHSTPFGRDHDAWMVGVSLRWNIFDGFRTVQGHRQARSAHAAANERLEQARKDASLQVHEAWLRRIEAEKRQEVARSALEAAEEAVRLISKRFDNALASMLDLLDARTALNQSRANMVESEANLKLAMGRLYHAAGIFLKEVQ